ncbi:hypothetical protein OAP41_00240 [Candidatus Poseidoniaceae archaeon]|nr:hypothetical protein [Candidatus Poseidoniaceae archaeon]
METMTITEEVNYRRIDCFSTNDNGFLGKIVLRLRFPVEFFDVFISPRLIQSEGHYPPDEDEGPEPIARALLTLDKDGLNGIQNDLLSMLPKLNRNQDIVPQWLQLYSMITLAQNRHVVVHSILDD